MNIKEQSIINKKILRLPSVTFLNLSLWANFNDLTDLSGRALRAHRTLRENLNLGLNKVSPAEQVEGGLRPSLLGWSLLDDLNSGLRHVEG